MVEGNTRKVCQANATLRVTNLTYFRNYFEWTECKKQNTPYIQFQLRKHSESMRLHYTPKLKSYRVFFKQSKIWLEEMVTSGCSIVTVHCLSNSPSDYKAISRNHFDTWAVRIQQPNEFTVRVCRIGICSTHHIMGICGFQEKHLNFTTTSGKVLCSCCYPGKLPCMPLWQQHFCKLWPTSTYT